MSEALIFNIQRFSLHDGPGIRTTVFLKGCPLRCPWCHNPESQQPEIESYSHRLRVGDRVFVEERSFGRRITLNELMAEIVRDLPFYEQSRGGVTFSGGEPLLQAPFLLEALAACHRAGIATAVDTCGCAPVAVVEQLAGETDLWLYDLKLIDADAHLRATGATNTLIMENLRLLAATGAAIKIRFPVIPGVTDGESNLAGLLTVLERLQVVREINLLPYHKVYAHKYGQLDRDDWSCDIPDVSQEQMRSLKQRLAERGFSVTIGG